MDVYWSRHAKSRLFERILSIGISEDEVERIIINQRVKTSIGYDKKYKTHNIECIDKLRDTFITIQKAESKNMIYVKTLWESKYREEEIWRKNIKKP